MSDYPCHNKPKDQWCDKHGAGGFMGHTCYNNKLIDEMIAHCPMLDITDCIGLVELVNEHYNRST